MNQKSFSRLPAQHTGVYHSPARRQLPALKWRFEVEKGISSPALVDEGVAYVGDWNGNFYALDVESGKEVWKFETEDMVCYPAVYDGWED